MRQLNIVISKLLVLSSLASSLAYLTVVEADDPPVSKESLHIYLLIGQSNMAGRAQVEEEHAGAIEGCFLLGAQDEWEPASNPLNRYSTIRKGIEIQRLNPGYGFAKAMRKANPEVSIGLVVNAKGGSKIEEWEKGTHFYDEALRRVREARKTGILKGVLWHQGEGNSREPDTYLEKLKGLIADLRKDLGEADLPFVAGQVFYHPETKPHMEAINQEIARLPEVVPNTGYVSSEGLTTFDNTHFDVPSTLILGERYAKEMQKLRASY